MALIEFQDLPNTTTPINAQNLNNNFDELDEKTEHHIITASMSSNFTKSTTDYEILPLNTWVIVGNKLTINNNSIVVGSNVSIVKVSAKLSFNSVASSGLKWLTIFKNNEAVSANPSNLSSRNMVYSTDTLVEVSAGDTITLKVNGSVGDIIRYGVAYSNITVEVIE